MKKIIIFTFAFSLVLSGAGIHAQQYGRGGSSLGGKLGGSGSHVQLPTVVDNTNRIFNSPSATERLPTVELPSARDPEVAPEPVRGGGNGGDGGFRITTPMFFNLTCKITDSEYCEYVFKISDSIDGPAISQWIKAVHESREIFVNIPLFHSNREEIIEALVKLEEYVLEAVENKLIEDVSQMRSFYYDSPSVKREKAAAVVRDNKVFQETKKEAAKKAGSQNWTKGCASGSFKYNYGIAHKQNIKAAKQGGIND